MIYLLDTTAFSDLLREDPATAHALAELPEDDTALICTIVRGEILFGLDRMPNGRKKDTLLRNASKYLGGLPCEPLREGMANRYAKLKLSRQKRGLSLDENDLWIASSALELGATIVTRDQDFQGIEGLPVVNWSVERGPTP